MAMDEWLKGVVAGSAAVLISTALSMRTTEKLIKEAEIDFANPEFGVTPAEDFTDSPRQNLAVGGYTFNAESPSGDDPMMADPTEEGGPAELFDESVVQDEQDGGVDFMNAETHTYKELTLENLPKDSLINMIESSSDLIIFYGDKEDLEDFDEENFGTVGEYYQEFIDGANRSRQKFPDAYADQKNAESPLEESPLTADPLTADPSDMGGPEDFSAENYSRKDARRAQYIRKMQGYNDKQDESLGMRHRGNHQQSMKDRRDEASAMDKDHSMMGRKYDDVMTMDAQGYNDKMDESLGMRHRGKHQQSMKDRRDEASAMDKMHSKMGRKYDDVMTMDAEARRWRLPKTSKGTALYAKRDKSGKFTDIQNVARSTRADRARIAANQGVKSGQGDEGERMIYNAEFTNLTDHISTMYAAESEDLILCAHCDKKMSECGEHYTETYEASSSYNPYPVFMKPKDAAAVFAKNKNKLCTVTFVKKDGSMRTMKGRTGVFRDKSGKTIVGTGKKPSWSAKARADAGYMTFFDIDAARKAGDNRKGFRMINLNTISSIKAMGRKFDGAHPKGF